MRLLRLDGIDLEKAPVEVQVEESPSGWAWQNQQPLVVDDLTAESRFFPVLRTLHEKGLRSYCWLPLTTAQKRLGTLAWAVLKPMLTRNETCACCRGWQSWLPWQWRMP
jgi:GAF domain-containing protein